jgi:hypothetical protein
MGATAIDLTGTPEFYFPAIAVPMANKTTFAGELLHVETVKSAVQDIRRATDLRLEAAESHAVEVLSGVNPLLSGDRHRRGTRSR